MKHVQIYLEDYSRLELLIEALKKAESSSCEKHAKDYSDLRQEIVLNHKVGHYDTTTRIQR